MVFTFSSRHNRLAYCSGGIRLKCIFNQQVTEKYIHFCAGIIQDCWAISAGSLMGFWVWGVKSIIINWHAYITSIWGRTKEKTSHLWLLWCFSHFFSKQNRNQMQASYSGLEGFARSQCRPSCCPIPLTEAWAERWQQTILIHNLTGCFP